MPFLFCCKWQPNGEKADTCQVYNKWRTSQNCSSYEAPVIGSVSVGPHFTTFDRRNYTFNAKGEYSLVHVNNPVHKLDVQGRFEKVPKINATELTAVAARDNISSVVEFRLRPAAARWRYRMYVIVDKEYLFWWDESMRLQYFRGVTLYQPEGIQNMSHVIAMFDSGVGVEVMAIAGNLTVHVYAPHTFRLNGTGGLLGTQEDIDMRLGKEWRVKERVAIGDGNQVASLFFHDSVPFAHYDEPEP